MNNNPFQIMRALQNPAQMMPQLLLDPRIQNDPRARKTMDLLQKHDTDGLRSMAENICREYGTTPDQVRNQIQRSLPR